MVKSPDITQYLEVAMKASSLRRAVIANNIANANTPGYRRKAVEFEKFLAKAIASGEEVKPADVKMRIFQPENTSPDSTGNDVNWEVEFGEMIKNDTMYKTYVRLLSKLYRQMEMAIQG